MSLSLKWFPPALGLVNVVTLVATIITAGVFSIACPSMAAAETERDSAAVRARVEAYRNVWNTHEAASLVGFFEEDADFIMGNLPAAHGRQAIQSWWKDYFSRQEPERGLTIAVNSVRLLPGDAALVNIGTTTGGQDNKGEKLFARKARGTWLLHKKEGTWLISAMFGMPTVEDSVVLTTSLKTAESLKPEIRVFVHAYEDAFNNHDPAAVSAFYRNDADIIVRNDILVHGSQAIEDWWRDYFSKPRPYKAILIIDDIKMITPDVTLINIVATGLPVKAEGKQLPIRYTRAAMVLVREAGSWLIEALRILPSEDDIIIRASDR